MVRYFIARPIFACVCAALIVIAGLAALRQLPMAQWPNIQQRQISVTTFYPGANAETVASTVAAPLEQQIGNVPGLLYTQSVSSSNGDVFVNALFDIDANLDTALLDMNNRVQKALPHLPDDVRRQGVTVSKSATSTLLIATITSPERHFDVAYMANYVRLNILDELRRVPGVGNVVMSSARYYSLRIWLQPDKLARLGLTPLDVLAAVREQNSQFTAGRIGEEPSSEPLDFTFTVNVPGRLSEPADFEQIIVRAAHSGGIVRLKDVARVELGGNRYDVTAKLNGELTVPISVFLQPGANAIDTAQLVRARLQELSESFPAGLNYSIPFDVTVYVRTAIYEVVKTLLEAMLLVFAVVLIFMRNWRATLIPMLAVPVSIIGTFAIMYLMDFSINTITLFGMVFAIGIVVDDAIVVMENVERIMATQGIDARAATEQAMREVTRPVIAIVLVLTAVFMPVALIGGISGTIYRQFAITIGGSVMISGIVALTLTPALCANLLRRSAKSHWSFLDGFQNTFVRFTNRYVAAMEYLARHRWLAAAIFIAVLGVTAWFAYRIPSSLMPREDRAIVYIAPELPDAASLTRSQAVVDTLSAELRRHPAVKDVIAFAGQDGVTGSTRPNGGNMWVMLKPWDERRGPGLSPQDVVAHIEAFGANLRDAKVMAFEPSPITGGSSTGGFEGFIESRTGSDAQALARATQRFVAMANARPELKGVATNYNANVPQLRIDVDRDKAKLLGISLDELFTTMQSTLSAYYVNDFSYAGRVWEVQMQADAPFRSRPDDLRNISVRATGGALVPLTALTHVEEVTGPELVERYNGFPAARVYGQVAAGRSSGEALAAMERVAKETLPAGYVLAWSGSSYQERVIGKSSNSAFLLSIAIVFLILAAQYERWNLPIVVILTVPFAMFGAFLGVWLRGLHNDIFFQIGLVTLVGLAAKNTVLMVEYAAHLQAEGATALQAALQAARLRFRPIVMTSAAFVFGVLPLALTNGAGANGRHSIGTGVIGGMLAATFLATLFAPMFYAWIAGANKKNKTDAT